MAFRGKYWSNSTFANWIRTRFTNLSKPSCGTFDEWGEWEKRAKSENPKIYWFTEHFLDDLQNFIWFPVDKISEVRYYIRNRYFDKVHYLPTRLKPGQYHDLDTRLIHGIFESLVDFIEVEKAHMYLWSHEDARQEFYRYKFPFLRWKSLRSRELGLKYLEWEATLDSPTQEYQSVSQAQVAREQMELYFWWKDIRPNRADPHDVSGWSDYCDEQHKKSGDSLFSMFSDNVSEEEHAKTRKMLDLANDIENQYEKEDTEMLMKLIKIRKSLWT